ncbi:HAD superfamily (subfamily IIIA) phosphatase, TIGR01668 [Desulfotomaculum nigrificans CO-1-SRB]|uniref:HAD superfamily (Subfamily IIIA) phosphatase, TIGR01668 n=1 Tax=Desulfotomaculum nigrificans (strain DSM 14880 / VKM B-2319 / CO-1-SRB) TaxID=868595 RepID=F6BA59_DESCC|nr:YqeG family HAD IIIA-type phosphatase [Desulfotomaculum nigrificans]AEF95028.1 HAD superfamily (subfamily IIIA) phosphatase, TIGR01668 [Desulfotomaculum nigrificans CO-1-SRB]
MIKKLYPNAYVSSLYEINLAELKKRGIKAILFDIDNTIIPWDRDHLDPQVEAWFRNLVNQGFKVCFVSNNNQNRVAALTSFLHVPGVSKAGKPRRRGLRQALNILNAKIEETALVGDQVFTDVLAGNRLGLYTILVTPMAGKEFIGTKINRQLEKLVLWRIKRQQHN